MPLNAAWDQLPDLFPTLESAASWLPRLHRHWGLIEAAAPRVQVTSVSADDAVIRHYAESLELLAIMERTAPFRSLIDIGSGGGFPGLVIAIVRPDLEVHLVEPLKKRAALLLEIVTALGLPRVQVHAVRAEETARGALRDSSSMVTARAVAALPVLLEYTAPFAAPGGTVALPKGSGFEEELGAATTALAELAVEFVGVESMRAAVSSTVRVALFRKLGPTPAKYPRRAGAATKRPL